MSLESRGARVLRGAAVAGVSVVIAALSHVAGGGTAPGALGTLLAVTFAVLACVALAGRRLTLLRLVVAVVVSQLVFHILFSLGAAIPSAHGHSVSMLGMVMSGGHATSLPAFSSPHAVILSELEMVRMWSGHLMAAVFTIALVLHGEKALFTLVRLASGRLALLVALVSVLPGAPAVSRHDVAAAIADRRGIRPLDVLLAARPRRGPPVMA